MKRAFYFKLFLLLCITLFLSVVGIVLLLLETYPNTILVLSAGQGLAIGCFVMVFVILRAIYTSKGYDRYIRRKE